MKLACYELAYCLFRAISIENGRLLTKQYAKKLVSIIGCRCKWTLKQLVQTDRPSTVTLEHAHRELIISCAGRHYIFMHVQIHT